MSFVFFFKQKTAYEMRISDWSSDVCSSDLLAKEATEAIGKEIREPDILLTNKATGRNHIIGQQIEHAAQAGCSGDLDRAAWRAGEKIGIASWRERVGPDV